MTEAEKEASGEWCEQFAVGERCEQLAVAQRRIKELEDLLKRAAARGHTDESKETVKAQITGPCDSAEELQKLKKQFENRGGCRVLSTGSDCRCPLCVLDDATARIKELESAVLSSRQGPRIWAIESYVDGQWTFVQGGTSRTREDAESVMRELCSIGNTILYRVAPYGRCAMGGQQK